MTTRHRQQAALFHERLRQARAAAGMSQAQFAQQAGTHMDRNGISRLERGRTGATTKLAAALAQALDVPVEWLTYGHDCNTPGGTPEGYEARLRQARKRAGYTQDALRRILQYQHRSAVSALESEDRDLDLALGETVAQVLGVPPEWLAFGHQCGTEKS